MQVACARCNNIWRERAFLAHVNKVMKSINGHDDSICVDIFLRPDGSFGFEEYRRDVEDARGWFPIGNYYGQVFSSEEDALNSAKLNIAWLASGVAAD